MDCIWGAVKLMARTPGLWKFAVVPTLLAAFAFLLVVVGGYFVLVPWLSGAIAGLPTPAGLERALVSVAYFAALLFVAGPLFVAIASLVSGFFWDRLSMATERALGLEPVAPTLPVAAGLLDNVTRLALAAAVGLGAFCLGLVVPVVMPILAAGLLGLVDFTASPFLRRGCVFGCQRRYVFGLKGWPGFALGAGVLALSPLINVFALPVLVVAGTMLYHRSPPELPTMVAPPRV